MDSESADRVDFTQALLMICVDAGLQSFEGFGIKVEFPKTQPPQVVLNPGPPMSSVREGIKSGTLSSSAAGDQAGYEKLFGGNLPSFGAAPPAQE